MWKPRTFAGTLGAVVAPNGRDPLVDTSGDFSHSSERQRSSERHRVRRRVRLPNVTRTRIRLRMWLACAGALLVMAVGIYLMLDRGG
jgi:hypothetical protein